MYICTEIGIYMYINISISISTFTYLSLSQLFDLFFQFHFPQFLYLPTKESRRLNFRM